MPRTIRTPPQTPSVAPTRVTTITSHEQRETVIPTSSKTDDTGVDMESPQVQHASSLPELNFSKKRKFDKDQEEENKSTSVLRNLFMEFSASQEKQFGKLYSHFAEIRTELRDDIKSLSGHFDQLLTRITSLEDDRKEDKKKIKSLEDKIENLERKSRSTGIEIRNLPKTTDNKSETKDDLISAVTSLGNTLQVPIQLSDLRDIYRTNNKDPAPPLIMEFTSVIMKENFMSAVKKFNKNKAKEEKLNTSHAMLQKQPPTPIYISETLTQRTQKLYFMARTRQRENGFSFCWTSRGIVYLRKNEDSPLVKITNEEDFVKFRKTQD